MKQTLAEFPDLTAAEQKLRDWLQSGNRKLCVISPAVPDSGSDDVTLRATFLRYLALGGCDDCRLPETGLQVQGAYILGDDGMSEETNGLDLEGATLPGDLALLYCQIPDLIRLRSAKLKNLFLSESHLKRGLEADGLRAEGSVFLREVQVQGEVRLLGAKLGGNLDCDGASLSAGGDALICDGLQSVGSVFLRGAQVQGEVRLLGAKLGGELDCEGARLSAGGDALNCERATIKGAFFLRDKAHVTSCINLLAANFGAMNDDPDCWPPEVILDRCRYGAFTGGPTDAKRRLRWLALQQPGKYGEDFWPDPYEHCAKVLREMGHGADARTILIEKERLQREAWRNRLRKQGQVPFATLLWLSDWLLSITTRYGRQPLLAFLWLFGFWVFGALVFDQAAQRGEIKPNLPQIQVNPAWHECAKGGARRMEHPHQVACFEAQSEGASYPSFHAVFYSADTLFPVVSLEMQSNWIPDDGAPFGKWARWYLWVHIALGWALTLLAVAGFSGLIKTDNTQ